DPGGVHDEQDVVVGEPVGDQVVDRAAVLVEQQRVLRPAGLDPVDVVREHPLHERDRAGAAHLELAHVETSKTPAWVRTAWCSGMTPWYCTGISHPAKGTIRAPAATWRSRSGVCRRPSDACIRARSLSVYAAAKRWSAHLCTGGPVEPHASCFSTSQNRSCSATTCSASGKTWPGLTVKRNPDEWADS